MAKQEATKAPPKKGTLVDDGSPIIIQGGIPLERDTSSVLVNLVPRAEEPHHISSPRTSHRVSKIGIDGTFVKVNDDDWSICVFPQMLIAYSENGRKTVQLVSRRGFEAMGKRSRD